MSRRRSVSRDPPQLCTQSQIRATNTDCSSVAGSSSVWHDERIQRIHNNSNTFQKRLEEQAAAAIIKAQQNTKMDYQKKLKNSLKTLEAIEMRKKNDLRLVELRKKAEMEKVKHQLAKEAYEAEKRALKEVKESLKKQVLNIKGQNSELQYDCRKTAAENKQLLAEIESNQIVAHEVEQHNAIVAQLDNINSIFSEAHLQAVQDLKRLEDDCKKETKEKKKIQNWIDSLITLMEHRCKEPVVMRRIHKIESQAESQRALVAENRRKRGKSSSRRSHKSGTTTALRKKVQHMRKHASEHHILEDRAKLSAALAARREEEEARQDQEESAREQQTSSRTDKEENGREAFKKAKRINKKMDKRRQEIENIVSEMKKLDVDDDKNLPPSEIYI